MQLPEHVKASIEAIRQLKVLKYEARLAVERIQAAEEAMELARAQHMAIRQKMGEAARHLRKLGGEL